MFETFMSEYKLMQDARQMYFLILTNDVFQRPADSEILCSQHAHSSINGQCEL